MPHEYDVFDRHFKQRYSLLEALIEVMTKLKLFSIRGRPTYLHPIQKPRSPI